MSPLLDRFFNGENCLLFAHGVTNSGKSYTIRGTETDPGLLPVLVDEILEIAKRLSMKSSRNWNLQISIYEIYQEKIFDLLVPEKEKLTLFENGSEIEILKLTTSPLQSIEELSMLLEFAAARRCEIFTEIFSIFYVNLLTIFHFSFLHFPILFFFLSFIFSEPQQVRVRTQDLINLM